MAHPIPAPAPLLSLTQAAIHRVQELIEEEGNYNLKLRVYITGGGCSGFQYGFMFDENLKPDDEIIEKELEENEEEEEEGEEGGKGKGGKGGKAHLRSVKVIIDALSLMYLTGAEIDYKESLQGARFIVKNPHAQTTCSCGSSFALER